MPKMKRIVLVGGITIGCIIVAHVALLLYGRLFAGHVQQRVVSQDGAAIAEVRQLEPLSAMDANLITVELRTRFNPFRQTVFGGLDYGGEIKISWIDSRDLLVQCLRCDRLDIRRNESAWHNVAVHYEIQGGIGPPT
jgi:hypothetical protein